MQLTMKKRLLILFVALALILPVSSCAEDGGKAQPCQIGVIAQLSGFAAITSRPARDGFVWVIEQVNDKGGVDGRQIELTVYDGRSDVNASLSAARRLIYEDRVLAVVELGAGTEMGTQAMKPICQDAGIPLIVMGTTLPLLARPAEWVFTMSPHHPWAQAPFYGFCKERGLTKVAIIAEGYGHGLGSREVMEVLAPQAGIELVAVEQFGPTDVDMTPQLWRIKMAAPDILLVAAVTLPGAVAIGQARDMGIDVPIYAFAPIAEPSFVAIWPEALEGVYVSMSEGMIWEQLPEDNQVRPKAEALDAAITEKYGRDVGIMDQFGADLADCLCEALRLAGIETEELAEARAMLRDAMERVEIAGAFRSYKYTPEDHNGMVEPFGTGVLKDGEVTFVEWADVKNNLYWPEGYDGLIGM